MYETIKLDVDGRVATITFDRPPFNLFSFEMLEEIRNAFDVIETRGDVRAVVLTGAGERAFSAGADLGDEARHSASEGRAFRELGRFLVERIETFPAAVISAVRGWCIGGGTGLAWAADIRIAAESARFRAGGVYLGIIPTWSIGMVRLVHYLGRNRTLDLLLLGEDVDARTAEAIGLVSRVVPNESFEAEVRRVAERLASGAPLPVRAIKEAVRAQYRDGPDRAALLEERWAQRILESRDAHEGMAAFREKRKADFKGE
ncbi:MAG TPA: enoyl-CoA hydratase/isomerase family protein [Beijerinckiaceae bacterium]|nr:enoyl-CoA hydratase/isomerase family protein [Beijerinckiaceae bacterium]